MANSILQPVEISGHVYPPGSKPCSIKVGAAHGYVLLSANDGVFVQLNESAARHLMSVLKSSIDHNRYIRRSKSLAETFMGREAPHRGDVNTGDAR